MHQNVYACPLSHLCCIVEKFLKVANNTPLYLRVMTANQQMGYALVSLYQNQSYYDHFHWTAQQSLVHGLYCTWPAHDSVYSIRTHHDSIVTQITVFEETSSNI